MSFSWPEFWTRLDVAVEHWVADLGLEAVVDHNEIGSLITEQDFRVLVRVRPEPYRERYDKRAWEYRFDGRALVDFLEREVPGIFERPTAAAMQFAVEVLLEHPSIGSLLPRNGENETRAVEAAMQLIRYQMEWDLRRELEREPIKRQPRPTLLFEEYEGALEVGKCPTKQS